MKLPQLSLRELFLLVVIAAMGCGWWVERSRNESANHEIHNLTSECDLLHKELTGLRFQRGK